VTEIGPDAQFERSSLAELAATRGAIAALRAARAGRGRWSCGSRARRAAADGSLETLSAADSDERVPALRVTEALRRARADRPPPASGAARGLVHKHRNLRRPRPKPAPASAEPRRKPPEQKAESEREPEAASEDTDLIAEPPSRCPRCLACGSSSRPHSRSAQAARTRRSTALPACVCSRAVLVARLVRAGADLERAAALRRRAARAISTLLAAVGGDLHAPAGRWSSACAGASAPPSHS